MVITTTRIRAVLVIVAIAAFIGSAFVARTTLVIGGVITTLLLTTSFGASGRLAKHLENLIGQHVEVSFWGKPFEAEAPLRMRSVFTLGAGLHFMFEHDPRSAGIHVKVAQPGVVILTPNSVTAQKAKYIQVDGRNQPLDPQQPALALALAPRRDSA